MSSVLSWSQAGKETSYRGIGGRQRGVGRGRVLTAAVRLWTLGRAAGSQGRGEERRRVSWSWPWPGLEDQQGGCACEGAECQPQGYT